MAVGQMWYNALQGIGNDAADAINKAQKESDARDAASGRLDALSRVLVDSKGHFHNRDSPAGDKDPYTGEKMAPILDSTFVEQHQQRHKESKAYLQGQQDAISRLGIQAAGRIQASNVEDASISGQRAAQSLQQDQATAQDRQDLLKAQVKREQGLADQTDKQWVDGFGYMTAPQKSAHDARMERIAAAKEKLDPVMKFKNQIMSDYGLTMQDVLAASQNKFQGAGKDAGTQYTGVPYVDAFGNQVPANSATLKTYDPVKNPIYAKVPPYGATVPLNQWQEMMTKSQSYTSRAKELTTAQGVLDKESATAAQQQAQTAISIYNQKDPSTLTDLDRANYAKAKAILGQ